MNHPPTAHVMIDTTDPARAEAHLAAAYGGAMKASAGSAGYRFRHVRLGPGPFHIDTLEDTKTTRYNAGPLSDLTVMRVHRGVRTDLDTGDRFGPGDLAIHAPGEPSDTRLANILLGIVYVPLQAAVDVALNGPDDDLGPLRFSTVRPAHPAATRSWLRTVDYVITSLTVNPDAMTQPLVATATTRLMAASLLATFPNTWTTEQIRIDRTDATPTTLSRAVAFIDANADLDITAVDIARAAHVTVRAVQLAFRRHLDTTPAAYLRRVRLEHAHRQLQAATPGDGTTVTTVAARWGYTSPSRFAVLYRQTYRQLPSHTLRN
jgi:AraC-like DNA-binding protein